MKTLTTILRQAVWELIELKRKAGTCVGLCVLWSSHQDWTTLWFSSWRKQEMKKTMNTGNTEVCWNPPVFPWGHNISCLWTLFVQMGIFSCSKETHTLSCSGMTVEMIVSEPALAVCFVFQTVLVCGLLKLHIISPLSHPHPQEVIPRVWMTLAWGSVLWLFDLKGVISSQWLN